MTLLNLCERAAGKFATFLLISMWKACFSSFPTTDCQYRGRDWAPCPASLPMPLFPFLLAVYTMYMFIVNN
jgi:hypothetical protein